MARKAAADPVQRLKYALQNGTEALHRGVLDQALDHASKAFHYAETVKDRERLKEAQQLLAEVHFRLGVADGEPKERLTHLDMALQLIPDDPRIHFRRGVLLWQAGHLDKAMVELETVAARTPQRPGLTYLRQLARLAAGQPWEADGLSRVEVNTLRLIQGMTGNGVSKRLGALAQDSDGEMAELWSILLDMQRDAATAPVELLEIAVEVVDHRPVKAVLYYYLGVAALRKGEVKAAADAWQRAVKAGFNTPWLQDNLVYLRRQQVIELAQADRWQEIVNLADSIPDVLADRILAETVGVAHHHLGYRACEAGNWRQAAQHWRVANQYVGSRHLAQNLALAEEALGNWVEAAEAWREMARRRPRKETHPDYLSDAQVAAIWKHAAECYEKEGETDEAITCLRTAIKYHEDNLELHLELADTLWSEDRVEATINELQHILELDANYVPALTRLATLYTHRWGYDPVPLWRRVLAVEPENIEARDALADHYLAQVGAQKSQNWFASLLRRSEKEKIELLKQGLEDVPGHPRLLLQLGVMYREAGKKTEARHHLLEAYRAAPTNVQTVGPVLHELLHLKADDAVEELLPEVRQISGLLMAFWISQGEQVLQCKLNRTWAVRFFDEALALAEQGRQHDSKALALLEIFDVVKSEDANDLVERYVAQIRAEVPQSGVVEYVEARFAMDDKDDKKDLAQARRLLRKAQRLARRAQESEVRERAEHVEALLSGNINRILDMLNMFDLDEGDLDAFEDFFR